MSHYFLCSQNKYSKNRRFFQCMVSDFVAAEFPKTPSPKPARIPPQTPPAGGNTVKAGRIHSPRQIVSPCRVRIVPPPARILGGQNPERKTPFPFSKEISPPPNQKSKECFFFGVAEALRGSGGTIHSRSKKVRANDIMTPPNETLSELRKRSDFAGAKIALSFFSKPFPPTAEAVNSQSSPQLHE